MSGSRIYAQYQENLKIRQQDWENLCLRCGGCCGAYDDPCAHLAKDELGRFYCTIYQERLGERKAISGEEFDCVPIQKIIHTRWKKDYLCSYKKQMKMPWLAKKEVFKK